MEEQTKEQREQETRRVLSGSRKISPENVGQHAGTAGQSLFEPRAPGLHGHPMGSVDAVLRGKEEKKTSLKYCSSQRASPSSREMQL